MTRGAWCVLAVVAVLAGLSVPAAAQDPAPPEQPAQEPPPKPEAEPQEKPEEKPEEGPAEQPESKKDERPRPRFELLDPEGSPFGARPLAALGIPLVISPKAVGYVAAYPVVRLGRDNLFGTRVRLDPVIGLDNYKIGAPEIHMEVKTDLGGWSNMVRFSFQDSEFRGTRSVRTGFWFDTTFFPQGTVVDGLFSIQDVELKFLQRLGDIGPVELWLSLGGHYTRTFTRLKDPLGGRRESNVLEVPQFVLGGRFAITPAGWCSIFLEVDGMAWKTRGIRSASLRGSSGIEIRLGGGWGVVLDYSMNYFEGVLTGANRDEVQYLSFGPRLAILAGL